MAENNKNGKRDKITIRVDMDLEEIVPIFIENRHKDIVAITKALEQEDYDTIRILGHSMKGSGGGYGFDTITAIGNAVERAAKKSDKDEIRKQVNELSIYIERVEVVYE